MGKMGMEGGAGRGAATVTGCLGGQGHPHCTGETGLMPRSGLFRLHEKARAPFLLHALDPYIRARCPEVVRSAPGWDPLSPMPSRAGGICRVRAPSWLRLGSSWSLAP